MSQKSEDPVGVEFFRSEVTEYNDIDHKIKLIKEKIKPLNAEVKELQSKKNELQRTICDFMSKNEIDQCNLSQGSLQYKETKTALPITKAVVFDKLNSFFDNQDMSEFNSLTHTEKAKKLHTYLYTEAREYKNNTCLRKKN